MIRCLSAVLAAALLATAPSPPAIAATGDSVIAPVTTRHQLRLAEQSIDYLATIETVPVTDAKGASAHVAVIAYTTAGGGAGNRPVTFVFNGGPGASSAYLHLGALGPRVLATPPDGSVPTPPARLEDNADTWLAFTDLVFVDPIGTGFSRAAGPGDKAEAAFWSISADTRSLAEAIRLWLARHGRWESPKFIAGESFGGFRALQLGRALLDHYGIALNGLVLISPALEFSTMGRDDWRVLPWALVLPSMVAAARAHGKAHPEPPLAEVERFALSEYLPEIAAIGQPGPNPGPALNGRLADLLGLPLDLIERHHGRIPVWVFAENLLRGSGRALSIYDGAQAGPDPRPGRRGPDPQFEAIKAPLAMAYGAYVRNELKLRTDEPFRLLNQRTSRHWDWEGARGGPGPEDGAMDELAETLSLTPGLGVLVVHGRTDLVTPYMASRWLLDRLDVPEAVRARTRLEVLEGGHMMYLKPSERTALAALAAAFYRQRAPES